MMQFNEQLFNYALQTILAWEGEYVNHPKDPGGATKFGITLFTLSKWRKYPCTIEDVKNLTMEEAREIYKVWYWIPSCCDHLPDALAVAMFDCAVNQGVPRAKTLLQRALRVKVDGIIGPITLAAANSADEEQVLIDFMARRILHYASLKILLNFGFGWMRRVLDVYGRSLLLIKYNRKLLEQP